MNIYLISQEVNNEYDTFDSAIVAAENVEEAQKIMNMRLSVRLICIFDTLPPSTYLHLPQMLENSLNW